MGILSLIHRSVWQFNKAVNDRDSDYYGNEFGGSQNKVLQETHRKLWVDGKSKEIL